MKKKRPTLCIVAGPNGSGKTSATIQLLHNEWAENSIYINPDNIAQVKRITRRYLNGGHEVPISKIVSRYYKSLLNIGKVIPLVDRVYVYDNSVEDQMPKLLYRTVDGQLFKKYVEDIPEWAKVLI